MNQFVTFITSDTFKFYMNMMDIFIGLSILAFTAWISVQWINTWFVRHFGESFPYLYRKSTLNYSLKK